MSSTGRGAMRQKDDFYITPAWCVRAILPHLNLTGGRAVLDICCGEGAISQEIKRSHPMLWIDGVELDAQRARRARIHCSSVWNLDFLQPLPLLDQFTYVGVSNPPFSLAQEIIERALPLCEEAAFLLRLNFLGSKKRAAFHRKHPADVFVLPERPSFCHSFKCKTKGCKAPDRSLERVTVKFLACKGCGELMQLTSTDSTEYAWFVYGPKRKRHIHVLEASSSWA